MSNRKKILIIGNVSSATRVFRTELLTELIKQYSVYLISEFSTEDRDYFNGFGIRCIDVAIDRRGKNFFKDLKLLAEYIRYIKVIAPDLVLTFTIKPNIYAGTICQILKIKYIATVEGLGTVFNSKSSFINTCIKKLYFLGIKKAEYVFYLNEKIRSTLLELGVDGSKFRYIPGMGVNLERFVPKEYPVDRHFRILFIGRIMREKGIGELLKASDKLIQIISDFELYICGSVEQGEDFWLNEIKTRPWIKYFGHVKDPSVLYANTMATITTTYHEGLSTICLESAACARPILGTDIPGVKEVIDDGVTGLLIRPGDVNDVVKVVMKFNKLTYSEKRQMGLRAYKKVCDNFDRKNVVKFYLNAIGENI